jgi:hypothetical protein
VIFLAATALIVTGACILGALNVTMWIGDVYWLVTSVGMFSALTRMYYLDLKELYTSFTRDSSTN